MTPLAERGDRDSLGRFEVHRPHPVARAADSLNSV